MRDLRRLQEAERAYKELRRSQVVKGQQKQEEEWDSRFESRDNSLDFEHSPKLGYNRTVESKLQLLLGEGEVDHLARKGRSNAKRAPEATGSAEQSADGQAEPEEEPRPATPEKGDLSDGEEPHKSPYKSPKKDSKLEEEFPLNKTVKPWEEKDPEDRTEVRLGVKYDKAFETRFDDRLMLNGRKPIRIVRVVANYNRDFLVGVQFTYMTEEQELVQGRLHGNNKKILDSLRSVQYEIQFREKIERVAAHFSKGIHWVELTTNEGRVLLLGNKQTHATAVTQTKELSAEKGEEVGYVSGGFTGRDYRFTYLSFHLLSGWNKPKKEEFP